MSASRVDTEGLPREERLRRARIWWAVLAYELMNDPNYGHISKDEVIRFIGKLGGVGRAELGRVFEGEAHLSAEALGRLKDGLGNFTEFHNPDVLSADFERGILDIEDRIRYSREQAELKGDHPRRGRLV